MAHLPWYKRIFGTGGETGNVKGEPDHCQELRASASAYLDGEMPTPAASSFSMHLKLCEGCESWMSSFSIIINTIHGLPKDSTPPDSLIQRISTISRG